jgi:PKD repeat protein
MCVFQNITGWAPVVSYAIARFDFLPSDPFVNEVVTFDASQSYNTTQISLFGWTWDDGQSNTTTAFSITHSYGSAGLYTVTLNVTDAGATLSSFIFHSVNVSAVPAAYSYAVARFDFNPSNPTPGQHVVFNASQSYNTTDVAFNWDFGDGNITLVSDSFLVVHSFASNITYLVSLELHGTLTTVNSTMFFRSVNVTTASVGGGLSRTEPEDLASLVIAGFIGVVLLIGVIVIVTRGRRR